MAKTKATIPAWLIMRTDWTTYRAAPLWTFSVLSLLADKNNQVTISVIELGETMQTEPRTISRHLDRLRQMGAITTHRGGVTEKNTFTLHMDGPAQLAPAEAV
jgi:DNA-binding MarR family transcriptional regulator